MTKLTDNDIKAIVGIREIFCITLNPFNIRLIRDGRIERVERARGRVLRAA
jgi:hypothetical protein